MMPTAPTEIAVKARKPRAPKPSSRPDAAKVKTTVYLTPEQAKRLGVYAVMTDADRSQVIAELIERHLRGFVVQDRRGESRDRVEDRQESAA